MARTTSKILASLALALVPTVQLFGDQFYYVDFDTIKDAFDADPSTPGLPPADEIYDYAPEQRDFIIDYLNMNFGLYGFTFVEGLPVVPGGSVIKLNAGFGAGADGVDFRNEDGSDDATVNTISIFKFLGKTPGTWTDDDVMMATANIVGHEAGHLTGMRHHDAYGPIGTGIVSLDVGDFTPSFPGPTGAGAAGEMIAALHVGGAAFGFTGLTTPKYVSEREAVRYELTRPFSGAFVDTDGGGNHTVGTAQPIDVDSGGFVTPYPFRPEPDPSEVPVSVPTTIAGKAKVVVGAFDPGPLPGTFKADYYEFFGTAGEIWTIEVMSKILEGGDRYADTSDPAVIILDPDNNLGGGPGGVVPYHTDPFGAVNDDDDDGELGASLIDLVLPYTGFYTIELLPSNPFIWGITGVSKGSEDGGAYELYLYSAMPDDFVTISIPGDTDLDGDVDGVDVSAFFSNFNGPGGGPPTNPLTDIDGDGDVDGVDISGVFTAFTGPLAPANIPEPSSLALVMLGGLAGLRRRRR